MKTILARIGDTLAIILTFVVCAAIGAVAGFASWRVVMKEVPPIYLPRMTDSLDGMMLFGLAMIAGFALLAGICGVVALIRNPRPW